MSNDVAMTAGIIVGTAFGLWFGPWLYRLVRLWRRP
jgi:hypothetical protein